MTLKPNLFICEIQSEKHQMWHYNSIMRMPKSQLFWNSTIVITSTGSVELHILSTDCGKKRTFEAIWSSGAWRTVCYRSPGSKLQQDQCSEFDCFCKENFYLPISAFSQVMSCSWDPISTRSIFLIRNQELWIILCFVNLFELWLDLVENMNPQQILLWSRNTFM